MTASGETEKAREGQGNRGGSRAQNLTGRPPSSPEYDAHTDQRTPLLLRGWGRSCLNDDKGNKSGTRELPWAPRSPGACTSRVPAVVLQAASLLSHWWSRVGSAGIRSGMLPSSAPARAPPRPPKLSDLVDAPRGPARSARATGTGSTDYPFRPRAYLADVFSLRVYVCVGARVCAFVCVSVGEYTGCG